MLTAHILTNNNVKTIQKTIESLKQVDLILVNDFDSTDQTVQICKSLGAEVFHFKGTRDQARNFLLTKTASEWNILIEPWETIVSMPEVGDLNKGCYYASIIQNKMLIKEIRLWSDKYQFVNPVFEQLNCNTNLESNLVFYSIGRQDQRTLLDEIEKWKEQQIYNPIPYYYQACILLSMGNYDAFLPISEHYMFLESKLSISSVMNRYYYAMVQITHKKSYKPALQNLNLCLCAKPLMAEFWCLLGDTYYHLLRNFQFAKEFYENAIILGSKRLQSDKWPMDIPKYKAYPQKMIESCKAIIEKKETIIINKQSPGDSQPL